MELERKITLRANGLIELAPPADNPKLKEIIDHSSTLKLIGGLISEADQNGAPKIIGIEGDSGVGKSILAELLTEAGSGDVILVSRDPDSKVREKIGLPPMSNNSATYIFDEPVFVTDSSLINYVQMLIEGGGVAILMSRHLNELPDDVLAAMIKLKMTRTSINKY